MSEYDRRSPQYHPEKFGAMVATLQNACKSIEKQAEQQSQQWQSLLEHRQELNRQGIALEQLQKDMLQHVVGCEHFNKGQVKWTRILTGAVCVLGFLHVAEPEVRALVGLVIRAVL